MLGGYLWHHRDTGHFLSGWSFRHGQLTDEQQEVMKKAKPWPKGNQKSALGLQSSGR
jgi:hypothetical protein